MANWLRFRSDSIDFVTARKLQIGFSTKRKIVEAISAKTKTHAPYAIRQRGTYFPFSAIDNFALDLGLLTDVFICMQNLKIHVALFNRAKVCLCEGFESHTRCIQIKYVKPTPQQIDLYIFKVELTVCSGIQMKLSCCCCIVVTQSAYHLLFLSRGIIAEKHKNITKPLINP